MLDNVLRDANVSLAQLDGIAFGAGPGSFTGVRIACGVAQGLALGGRAASGGRVYTSGAGAGFRSRQGDSRAGCAHGRGLPCGV
ncbi:MAG: hypothetical protein WDM70_10890 [Nitrosomonadales bacterium]